MVSSINIALSGLQAASVRAANSANNIANQFSTSTSLKGEVTNQPFVPQTIQQTSLNTGGVQTVRKDSTNGTTQLYNPSNPASDENGLVTLPNVDTATELVKMQVAGYDFKANLRVIKAEDEMQQSLLDILT